MIYNILYILTRYKYIYSTQMRPFKSYHQQERQLKQIYTEQNRTSKIFIRKSLLAEQENLNLFISKKLRLIIQDRIFLVLTS